MSSSKARIVILISGRGSNMEAIIKASQSIDFPAQINCVISNVASAQGLEIAQSYDIPTRIVAHTDFNNRHDFEAALCSTIKDYKPDLVCLAGFMRILGETYFNLVTVPTLNIHPSLLPKHKGLHTHQAALNAGDLHHGVTVHHVTPDLDAGAIIVQESITINKDDTAETLAGRLLPIEHKAYPAAIRKVLET